MRVQLTILYRLKKALEADAPYWLSDSLDSAVDLLASEEAGAIAPLREALSVMLYTRAIACCENQADIPTIDRLLAAITKNRKTQISSRAAFLLAAPPGDTQSPSSRTLHRSARATPARGYHLRST
jgi:hypothetical protein